MRVYLFAICESYSIDAATNKVSVFGILDDVNSASYPTIIPRLSFVAQLHRDDAPTNPAIELRFRQGAEEVWKRETTLDFGELRRARLVGEIGSLLVKVPGPMDVEIVYQGNVLSSWQLSMNLIGPNGEITQPSTPAVVAHQGPELASR